MTDIIDEKNCTYQVKFSGIHQIRIYIFKITEVATCVDVLLFEVCDRMVREKRPNNCLYYEMSFSNYKKIIDQFKNIIK